MPEFQIEEVLERLRVIGPANLSGPQGEWIREAREVLEGYKARATALSRASKSTGEEWEVTLVVSEPPDLGCLYALVPFPGSTASQPAT